MVNIVYCYITNGENTLPDHLFDSLYQTCLIHSHFQKSETYPTIYLITNSKWIDFVNNKFNELAMDKNCKLIIIPSEKLDKTDTLVRYNKVAENFNKHRKSFRDGFWIYTTTRFLYISAFMEEFSINNVFHIETDVMIYENLKTTLDNLKYLDMHTKIVAVQDAPNRAVCSLVYLPNIVEAKKYAEYITSTIENCFINNLPPLNDMDLMGIYHDKFHFPDSPYAVNPEKQLVLKTLGVYDANGIGQYLGGIDFRNIIQSRILNKYVNPTQGFINETATFKPDTAVYHKAHMNNVGYNGKKFFIGQKTNSMISHNIYDLQVIHVHSKQLYLFSSVFDLNYLDLISGDRIISICDFVFVDQIQYNYNKNLMKHNSNVLLVKNFSQINFNILNSSFDEYYQKTGRKTIRLFIFIDIMPQFNEFILPRLSDKFKYVIYSHNGDYSFDNRFYSMVNNPKIEHIFAQNLDLPISSKTTLLPIGIARDMFPHGNLNELYEVMISSYYLKKDSAIYININESTHNFRKEVMNTIRISSKDWKNYIITQPTDFKNYLISLSKYRFCLCLRGNGLDTHRFWEALYLSCIPVIVNHPSLHNFINNIRQLHIPHVLIDSIDFFNKENSSYFSQKLYDDTLKKFCINASIQCMPQLSLKFFTK